MAVADDLMTGETIVFESKKHWMAPVRASLTAILLIVGAGFIRWISPSGDGFFGTIGGLLDLVALGLFFVGLGWIVYNVVAWRTAEFAVSNMRVLREEGLVSRRSSTTLLSGLSDVKSNVGLLGGKLDYGDVVLLTQSGGAGQDTFLCITKPIDFRNAVMNQKVAEQGASPAGAAVTPSGRPPMTSAEAATAISSLADLRDRGAITPDEFDAKKAELLARM
ncbi:MAG: SHOCT domain-containing protein [Chloroflexota bacterium]